MQVQIATQTTTNNILIQFIVVNELTTSVYQPGSLTTKTIIYEYKLNHIYQYFRQTKWLNVTIKLI